MQRKRFNYSKIDVHNYCTHRPELEIVYTFYGIWNFKKKKKKNQITIVSAQKKIREILPTAIKIEKQTFNLIIFKTKYCSSFYFIRHIINPRSSEIRPRSVKIRGSTIGGEKFLEAVSFSSRPSQRYNFAPRERKAARIIIGNC